MEQSELLHFLVTALENLHLRYFVTGSTVTIFYDANSGTEAQLS